MMTRKDFLKTTSLASAFLVANSSCTGKSVEQSDEDVYWQSIRNQFIIPPDFINLNNGAVSPQPLCVQEAQIKYNRLSNQGPSYFMWQELDKKRETVRAKLAQLLGCNADELAINRNTTEGLNTIIFGLDLKPNAEVVLCKYDYPHMLNAWKQREQRDALKLKWVDVDIVNDSDETIIEKYKQAITDNTSIVHLTHVINWTGRILPVKTITEHAHAKGCEVIVDGAHSFAQIDCSIADLGCDYFATSLHKWLCAPFGTGALFVKKNKIKNLWPLLSSFDSNHDSIRKFETLGTRSFAAEMAVEQAIDFHLSIGIERKSARLRFLRNYWVEKVSDIPKVKIITPDKHCCGITAFTMDKTDAVEIDKQLFHAKQIHTSVVKVADLNAIRISPHIYTSTKELDSFVEVLKTI